MKAKKIFSGNVTTAGGAVTQEWKNKDGPLLDALPNYITIVASAEVGSMSLAIAWSIWTGEAWLEIGNTGASPITANGTTRYGFGWGAAAGAIVTAAVAFPMAEKMKMVMTPTGGGAELTINAYVA